MRSDAPDRVLSAEEIANYVVCPESWRLKFVTHQYKPPAHAATQGTTLKRDWTRRQDLSRQLSSYAKIAYLLLVALVIIVFMLDQRRSVERHEAEQEAESFAVEHQLHGVEGIKRKPGSVPADSSLPDDEPERAPKSVPDEIIQLLLVLGLLIFMWDLFERRSNKLKSESGLSAKSQVLAAKGSSVAAVHPLESTSLGLSSLPDAIVKDGTSVIPVAIHPLTNKVRDRHVVQLLVHLRLLEESHGKPSPYGVLVMGKKQRRVQVANTAEKQRWLESLIDEMRSILDGIPAVPAPSFPKCKHCDVRQICKHAAA